MKRSNRANDTPEVDPVQVRIALLLSGKGYRDLAREWGCTHITIWRAANNLHCKSGKGAAMRRRLADFIKQTNPQQQEHRS